MSSQTDQPWLADPIVQPAGGGGPAPWERDPIIGPAELDSIGYQQIARQKAKEYLGRLDQLAAADPEVRPQVEKELGVSAPKTFDEFFAQTAPLYRQPALARVAKGAGSALFGEGPKEPPLASAVGQAGDAVAESTRAVPGVGPLLANTGRAVGEMAGGLSAQYQQAAGDLQREIERPKSVLEHIGGILGTVNPILSLVPGFGSGPASVSRNALIGAGKAAVGTGEMIAAIPRKVDDVVTGDVQRAAGSQDAAEAAARAEALRDFKARQLREQFVAPAARAIRDYGGSEAQQGVSEMAAGLAIPVPLAGAGSKIGAKVGEGVTAAVPRVLAGTVRGVGATLDAAGQIAPLTGRMAGAVGGASHGPLSAMGGAAAGAATGERVAPLLSRAGQRLRDASEAMLTSPQTESIARAAGQTAGQLTAAGVTAAEAAGLGALTAPAGREEEGASGMLGFAGALLPFAMSGAGKLRRAGELEAVREGYAQRGANARYGEALDAEHALGIEGLDPASQREIDVARGVLATMAGPGGEARKLVVLQPEAFLREASSLGNRVGVDAATARGFFRESDGTVVLNRGQFEGPQSVRQAIEHEGGHALWEQFARENPQAAEPIRQAIFQQIIGPDGEPTQYLRDFADAYGGQLQTADQLKQAAGYFADELMAQTGASLRIFAETGRLIRSPELSERIMGRIQDALVARTPNRIDLREGLPGPLTGGAVGVNPQARQQLREGFGPLLRQGLGRSADPQMVPPRTAPRTIPFPEAPGPLTGRKITQEALEAPATPAPATPGPLTGTPPAPPAPAPVQSVPPAPAPAPQQAGPLTSSKPVAGPGPLTRPVEAPAPAAKAPETPAAAPEPPAAPAARKAPPLSEADIAQIAAEVPAPKYNPRGTPEEKAAKIAEKKAEAVEKALWDRHSEGADTEAVTMRTDEVTGRKSISGRDIDPADPMHQRLLEANPDVLPEILDPIREAVRTRQPITIDYYSAEGVRGAQTAAARREAQAASSVEGRAAGETPAVVADKAILPTRFEVMKGDQLYLRGFSVDKFLGNAEKLLQVMADAGERPPFRSVNDPELLKAFSAYVENHRNGWKGDGSAKLRSTEGVDVPAGQPEFQPRQLPREIADFINLAAANEGAKSKGERGEAVRGFAEANDNPPSETGETNPLRARLEKSGMLKAGPVERVVSRDGPEVLSVQEQDQGSRNVFEPTSEIIALKLVRKVKEGAGAPEETNLRATQFQGDRGALVRSGVPRSDYVAGGFLPGRKVTPEQDRAYLDAVERGDMEAAQRMVDEAAQAAGYGRRLWHGTDQSEQSVGQYVGQRNVAEQRAALTAMASRFNIKHASDLASILERWQSMGMLEEMGASPADVTAARKLDSEIKAASGTYKKGEPKIGFNSFRMPSGELELGSHFGTRGQAETFGDAFPFNVRAGRSINTPDLGTWNYQTVMREARKAGIKISESEYEAVFNSRDNNAALRDLLRSKGVESLEYNNEAEGTGKSLIIFHPNQAKLADPVTRDDSGRVIPLSERFNPKSDDIRFLPGKGPLTRSEEVEPGFYSQLARAIGQKMPARATPEQLRGIINSSGAKAEEVKWSGILPWLEAQKGPVTKEAVQQFLADEGRVRFEEKRFEGKTKFAQYTLPGGKNYREVVLAMPAAQFYGIKELPTGSEVVKRNGIWWARTPESTQFIGSGETKQRAIDEALKTINEQIAKTRNAPPSFESHHFRDAGNYVAHMRLNDRVDAEGRPGLFVEEIQSDRHQKGREKGYRESKEQFWGEIELADGDKVSTGWFDTAEEAQSAAQNYLRSHPGETGEFQMKSGRKDVGEIPDAPFRSTWPLQMFKRALRDAVASGKEWIGWTTGETQAERFDLSKQVDGVQWDEATGSLQAWRGENLVIDRRRVPAEELPDFVGKELARELIKMEPPKSRQAELDRLWELRAKDDLSDPEWREFTSLRDRLMADHIDIQGHQAPPSYRVISGDGLKIGGDGMRAFYDKILPTEIGKYVKQWGAKVEQGEVPLPAPEGTFGNSSAPSVRRATDQEAFDAFQAGKPIWFGARAETGTNYTKVGGSYKSVESLDQMFRGRNYRSEGDFYIAQDLGAPIWRVTITPAMRAGVQRGQALFLPGAGPLSSPVQRAAAKAAAESGFASNRIADVIRLSGLPLEEAKRQIMEAVKRGQASLETGNWPDATPQERAAAIDFLGTPRLYVRFTGAGKEEQAQEAPEPFRAPALKPGPLTGGFSFADKFRKQ